MSTQPEPQTEVTIGVTPGWSQETIAGSTKARYLDTLENLVAIGRRRNDPTLAIAVSVEMLGLLVTDVRLAEAHRQGREMLDAIEAEILERIDGLPTVPVEWAPAHSAPYVSRDLVMPIISAVFRRAALAADPRPETEGAEP